MASVQHALFHELPRLPEGFWYEEKLLSTEQERALLLTFARLPFREFEFRGFPGKRRTVSFGWRYDFHVRELQPTEPIPTFLLALRQKAAEFAGLSEDGLQHALVSEYSPGAAIGSMGQQEIFRVLSRAEDAEAAALICNPTIVTNWLAPPHRSSSVCRLLLAKIAFTPTIWP
jgi:hypothetical protein